MKPSFYPFYSTLKLVTLLCVTLLGAASLAQAASLTASVDRDRVARDETLTLSLRLDSRAVLGQPDLTLLEPYFDILSNNKRTLVQNIAGRSEHSTQWDIRLAPKVVGRILIPAFELEGARSTPLQVSVSTSQAPNKGPQDDYYLELSTDSDSAYVDQQLRLSIRLYIAINLSNLEMQPLQLDNAEVIRLDEQQYQKEQNGRRFQVYELNYAIFPRSPGILEIPAQQFSALKNASRSLFDSRRGQPVRLLSQPRSIEILPRPEDIDPGDWLPAKSLTLNQTLSEPEDAYRVGEPITRTLTLEAEGVESNRLPPLFALDSPAFKQPFKQYPEPPKLAQQTPASGIRASRIERYGLVPTQAGRLELPAIELAWWDSTTNQPRTARIAAHTLQVLPARNAPTATNTPPALAAPGSPTAAPLIPSPLSSQGAAESNGLLSNYLLWSNLLWAATCLLLGSLWWRARRRAAPAAIKTPVATTPNSDEAQAFRALEAVCRQGDGQSIRQALSLWRALASTTALADKELDRQTQLLDRYLYAKTAPESLDTQALLEAVRACRQRRATAQARADGLPPLYAE